MALTPITIDELRERLDIAEVLSGYLRLERAGTELRGLCPFHDDHRPSLYVNAQKGLWLCRVENLGGNVFDFVMRQENLSFLEAAELLANRLGCTVVRQAGEAPAADRRSRLLELCAMAAELYERALWQSAGGAAARDYLRQRGVDEQTAKHFRLGYAPDGWDKLVGRLEREGVDLREAEQAGLLKARERGGGWYDRFRHRLMFPILDRQGRVVGFGGRILNPEDEPKYLNSTESPIFNKGRLLYMPPGRMDDLAAGAFVVEGYMDVIALWQSGITGVVATLGTALTRDHLKLLHRYTQQVTLCYDGDSAGSRATDRAAAMFLEEGLSARVLVLPAGQDPDDFVRSEGADALRARAAAAPEVVEYRLESALAGAGADPAARAEVVRETVVSILGDIRDELRAAGAIQRVATWWSKDTPGLQATFERTLARALHDRRRGARERGRDRESSPYRGRRSRAYYTERQLLSRLLRQPEAADQVRDAIGAEGFGDPTCASVYSALLAAGDRPGNDWLGALDEKGRLLAAELLCGDADDPSRPTEQLVASLRVTRMEAELDELRRRRTAADDEEEALALQRRIQFLVRQIEDARRGVLPAQSSGLRG